MQKFFLSGLVFSLFGCPAVDDTAGDTGDWCSAAAPDVSPDVLPDGVVGEAYSQQLTAFGEGEVWSVADGLLPEGLSLGEEGLLAGTPTTSGEFDFGVVSMVDDSEAQCPVHPASKSYTLTIGEPVD